MTNVSTELSVILTERGAAPFLFVGSGFSRRYIGLETWSDLLSRFCSGIRDFGFYSTSANGEMPRAASLMAKDFNNFWWADESCSQSREKYKDQLLNEASALKYEISDYLSGFSLQHAQNNDLEHEIEALARMNVDGIITTNWDLLLEELFPDYQTFVGQEELLFSNPQSIAEIYKIHGCATEPESLVLTENDYSHFNANNPYLAAKLITIFAEHPIIFLGYSLTDPHIQAMISDISKCLGDEKLSEFEKNLVFVVRAKGGESKIGRGVMNIGARTLNFTLVETDDFSEVYNAVESVKRQVPVRVLRFFKEQMYDLVKSSDPEKKLSVVDFDAIENTDDVEFVVGVGVASEHRKMLAKAEADKERTLSKHGYTGVTVDELFRDLLKIDSAFSPQQLLEVAFPAFRKLPNKFIPVYRYLRGAGINSKEELKASDYADARAVVASVSNNFHGNQTYKSQYLREYDGLSTAEIIAKATPEKATYMIPFQAKHDVDLDALRDFLEKNFDTIADSYKSSIRKLASCYDYWKYGF